MYTFSSFTFQFLYLCAIQKVQTNVTTDQFGDRRLLNLADMIRIKLNSNVLKIISLIFLFSFVQEKHIH